MHVSVWWKENNRQTVGARLLNIKRILNFGSSFHSICVTKQILYALSVVFSKIDFHYVVSATECPSIQY